MVINGVAFVAPFSETNGSAVAKADIIFSALSDYRNALPVDEDVIGNFSLPYQEGKISFELLNVEILSSDDGEAVDDTDEATVLADASNAYTKAFADYESGEVDEAANSDDVILPNFSEYDIIKVGNPSRGYTVDMVFTDTSDPTQDTVCLLYTSDAADE